MKKSLKKSKTIFQLITFLLKVVKITGGSYFILLMDDEAVLELAVGSCLDWIQRKTFPSSLQLRGFIVSCHPLMPCSCKKPLIQEQQVYGVFLVTLLCCFVLLCDFFFPPKRYRWQKTQTNFLILVLWNFLKVFLSFFSFYRAGCHQ